ncbi:MAG: carboxypeptidase regulatory-like domain-containing protein, partial [Acidobacteria bacterium]|nr:carboxypeptidase regulatory-like domain-containing protein [Acidobacteriota bacterium]
MKGQQLAAITLLLFTFVSAPGLAHAQSFTGTITGIVQDQSGAVVDGAVVMATNLDTRISRTATTNREGLYRVTSLLPGNYEIACEIQGFKRAVRSDVTLRVNETQRVDFELVVGAVTEQVEVVGEA